MIRLKYLAQLIMGTYKPEFEHRLQTELNQALIDQTNACHRLNKALEDVLDQNKQMQHLINHK